MSIVEIVKFNEALRQFQGFSLLLMVETRQEIALQKEDGSQKQEEEKYPDSKSLMAQCVASETTL